LYPFCLGNGSNCKGKHGSSTAASCSSKANGTDMKMLRKDLGRDNNGAWEEGTNEETLKTDSDGRDVELWY
jgi:hypothetical protein